MCELLGAEIEYAESCYDEEATPIHYGALYKALNPTNRLRKCITCGKSFTDPLKSHSCPEPELVQKFLVQNTEFSGQIRSEHCVCFACYKANLVIIKHLNDKIASTDLARTYLTYSAKSKMG